MPIKTIHKSGKIYGFRWGNHGKVYKVSSYGKVGAKKKAVLQSRAIFASGYQGDRR
jgi:hypothetical protein